MFAAAAAALGGGVNWPAVREAAAEAAEKLDGSAASAMRQWQTFYRPEINADFARRPAYWRGVFAPVLALLPPTVRLYRGQPHAQETRVTRAFLSWTEHRPEAELYAAGGVLRVADVPKARILAVLPHGRGLEWFVAPGLIPGERRQPPRLCGYVEIGDYAPGREGGWAPGTEARRKAERAILHAGGAVVGWKPRRADDDDYWSGYPPQPDHGILYVRLPSVVLAARLRAWGIEITPTGCGARVFAE